MPAADATAPGALAIEALTVALPPGADRPLALRNVSLRLAPGEILCVVGESGSGKSVMATAVMGLLAPGLRIVSGRILLSGTDLASLSEEGLRRVRGRRVAMVFQEPMTALNPLMTVGAQLAEMWRTHTDLAGAEIAARSLEALREVALPDPEGALRAFPHELSGGQRQRAMIAMALALEPEALICDEPTTALDVTTQAQVLALVRDLQRRRGTAVLFITHDFGVVAEIADRVAVMQRGVLVEEGPVSRVLTAPAHDYTRRLLAAVPPLRAPPARRLGSEAALEVRGLSKTYGAAGLFRRRRATRALDDVSLTLRRGTTLGVVGESGSGKSTLARCVVGLLAADGGEIRVAGAPLPRKRAEAAGLVQMVFQDPYASLNPRRRAGEQVAQGPVAAGVPRAEAVARTRELFALVGLDPAAVSRFPHEFSGGQRQRIGIARALAMRPQVLVADEPVSALDVSVQAQVLELLRDLRARLGLSTLFITHDLRVAAQVCDEVAVMRNGAVVEAGPVAEVFARPRHDYTRSLLAAVPGREAPGLGDGPPPSMVAAAGARPAGE
ncbi:MAG: ABC transporter, ATP-binding protein (cluster 5, nickel/peptides/opines) / ABC transporter, ATP-binding protein (cluster 5, nickel/peptides/opines) [uncultured Acetobacteraceae bacterium]|uniref:ABC transporter, ATP-binding protein (Cluster 5, nickel/peptides/opines) / ABC transporter, ATP-binding protein (Cluster 5, nickel/peptides/opines) n=1 Tax=uncultured Acetobacteraceae bacterium TaxID=169975 RepID=A0A6J4I654_9PROT|nr:MAG: ABC transporter, ATP-binding protein (cluster 5, nickel/peptides/opines) / ABC transporter, ATP-binding protein (cluster 5, nickel/peptides/opines) [uncultured Acetobacteraceae bacterium]